jgi:transposase-like protein
MSEIIPRCPYCEWPLDYELAEYYGREEMRYYCERCDLYFNYRELRERDITVAALAKLGRNKALR